MQLSGVRVLLVEDESAVAMLVEDFLGELGCTIAGSVARLRPAVELARQVEADVALVDVNLAGEMSYEVADILGSRGIAVVFATGYGEFGLPDRFRDKKVLTKPFRSELLAQTLREVVGK